MLTNYVDVVDLIGSLVGFLVWFIGLTTWITIYQNNRASWGATGDKISFLIPLGEPWLKPDAAKSFQQA